MASLELEIAPEDIDHILEGHVSHSDADAQKDMVIFLVPKEVVLYFARLKMPMPVFQELRKRGHLKCYAFNRLEVLHGFLERVLAVSYPWASPGSPDPDSGRLQEVANVFNENPKLQFMWMDWSCLPQGEARTEIEKLYFKYFLSSGAINLVYLGATVVSIVNNRYLESFWTQFEYILATRKITAHGFETTHGRIHMRFIESAVAAKEPSKALLQQKWSDKTVMEVVEVLSKDDVRVTNQSDKDDLLPKLPKLQVYFADQLARGGAGRCL
jgi:hypothetical protein